MYQLLGDLTTERIPLGFVLDGMELQFNIASADMLRDAQLHPENHRDLVVRIAGFSAYFVEPNEGLQDDVIRRTELDLV